MSSNKERSKLKEATLMMAGQGLRFKRKKWCVFMIITLPNSKELILWKKYRIELKQQKSPPYLK
jgi:hypothetical protein